MPEVYNYTFTVKLMSADGLESDSCFYLILTALFLLYQVNVIKVKTELLLETV